jgi:hypothetical protein
VAAVSAIPETTFRRVVDVELARVMIASFVAGFGNTAINVEVPEIVAVATSATGDIALNVKLQRRSLDASLSRRKGAPA